MHPLTNILVKIFAKGFYRVHTGFLIFLFVIIISYCFFINTAGVVQPDEVLFYNFILLLTFISSPVMTLVFFACWLIYTLKSWTYVSSQLFARSNQFLFYSSNNFGRLQQFKSWFYVHFIISLPLVFYAFIAIITGLFKHYYLIPSAILLYVLLLMAVSALLYLSVLNGLIDAKKQSWVLRLLRYWKKPFLSLFIYQVFARLKLTYAITKALSYLIIIGTLFSFADVRRDPRVAGLIILGIVIAHAILIYQQHKFEHTSLSFSRNFPYSRRYLYFSYIITWALLLLPESIWLFTNYNLVAAAGLFVLALSIIMLFHSLLYRIGPVMNKYLPWLLGLFLLLFWMIMFGFTGLLAPLNFIVSFMLFYNNYYKYEVGIK